MHIFFQIIIQTYNSNNWSVVTTPEEEEVAVSAVFCLPGYILETCLHQ